MTILDERVAKLETENKNIVTIVSKLESNTKTELANLRSEMKEIVKENVKINTKLDRIDLQMTNYIEVTSALNNAIQEVKNKPNKTWETIKNVIITGLVSGTVVAGIIYLIKKLIQL